MSDVYSDLNIKGGSKIVLGDSGVSISGSGCVVLSYGCSSDLSDMATKSYVDSKLSSFCTSGCIACYSGCEYLLFCPEDPYNCGTVAKLKAEYQNALLSANTCYRLVLQSEQECVITHSGEGIYFGIGGTYSAPDVTFSLPEKDSGTYTLATTEDLVGLGGSSGCSYPTEYPLFSGCSISGLLEYCSPSMTFCSSEMLFVRGCYGLALTVGPQVSSPTAYVPVKFPFSECSGCATIVTTPGYDDSGCGLQICVLSQSAYDAMSEHGMTTLYFISGC